MGRDGAWRARVAACRGSGRVSGQPLEQCLWPARRTDPFQWCRRQWCRTGGRGARNRAAQPVGCMPPGSATLPTELTPRLATPMPLALAGAVAATAPTPCSDGSSDDSRSRSRSPQAGPSLASSPAATTVSARCAQHTAAGAGAADATTASRVPDSRSHVAATTACSLLLGMFNRTESLTLSLPTIEYRGRCLEQFETVLNVAPMGPGGGPHGPATVHIPTAMAPDHKRKRCDALFDATADREPPFT
jgi:hypothetical protein